MTPADRRNEADIAAGLLAAARDLAPRFRARAGDALAARRLPRETVADLRRSGLLRVYNPRRFGGHELAMQDVLPIIVEIARSCPATAWVLAVYQIHSWVLALYPDHVQRAVFERDPDVVLSAGLNPAKNVARKVDGGYFIERGSYPFNSGADGRAYSLLGTRIVDDGGATVDAGAFLISRNDTAEADDWFASGLGATGSLSLVVENHFVPEDHFLSYGLGLAGTAPGIAANPAVLYRSAFVPMLVLNLAGPALGALLDAIEVFRAEAGRRSVPLTGRKLVEAPQTHALLADAVMRAEAAGLMLDRAAGAIRDWASRGEAMPKDVRARVCLETTHAVRECLAAVQPLFLAGGAGVLMPDSRLQRLYQDVSAINVHGFLGHETNQHLYGALALGQDVGNVFL